MGSNIRRTKEQAIETRTTILDSALKVFSRKGYSATTLEDIATEAGISRGAIYWNFKNKQELYVNLLREYFYSNTHELSFLNSKSQESPLIALKEYMYNYSYNLISNTKLREILEITRYKTEVKTISNEVLEVQQEMDWLMRDDISKLVKAGIEAGELKQDIDSEIIIMSILSYLNGIEDTWLINTEIFQLENNYKALIDLFISALVNR